jgi:hypothetical protein
MSNISCGASLAIIMMGGSLADVEASAWAAMAIRERLEARL